MTTNKTTLDTSHPDYPRPLLRLPAPPPELFVRGALPAKRLVALVGSRAASMDAVARTKTLAGELVRRDLAVISGGAIGVDTAGHLGALEAGGRTVAVLGSGLDHLYPERNIPLFERIAQDGALLTSYPHDAPPRRSHFPQRNGIIAAMAACVVVLEAGVRSGALNTAKWARRLGVPLLAWPGSPGCAQLLNQGAGRVTGPDLVMAAVDGGAMDTSGAPPPDEPDHARLLELMGASPRDLDTLAAQTGWSTARVALRLVQMEVGGYVMEQGGRYRKV